MAMNSPLSSPDSRRSARSTGRPLRPLRLRRSILLLGIFTLALPAGAESAPTYAQVHAVFAKHCVSCHNAKDEEGELVLENFTTLMKGGESGQVVVPGKGDESLLVKLIRHEKKPYMPPPKKAAKLSDAEIALVKGWVDAGA